ncbi:MAG: GNAT family N-acetyltransferase [Marmoricola sp.]
MDDEGAPTRGHMLGAHVVGKRVVVRRVLPGRTGPTGGPAMTDVLGICESWANGRTVIRREDGSSVEIRTADIVSGKPVPPRPSVRMRVSAEEVERRAATQLRPLELEHLGDWLLRSTGGSTGRTNSVLPLGDPGLPFDEALTRVLEFYAERKRPAWAQVVVDSPVHLALEERGWTRARPDEADSEVLLASVAQARRALQPPLGSPLVTRADRLDRGWLAGNDRALASYETVRHQLETNDALFAAVVSGERVVARGRATYDDDWVGLTDLYVEPERRRSGLATVVLTDLLEWAAERGASTALLQVLADNEPAQRFYAVLGFRRHHAYRYLAAR